MSTTQPPIVPLAETLTSRRVTVRRSWIVQLPDAFPTTFDLADFRSRVQTASGWSGAEVDRWFCHLAVSQLLIQFRKAVEDYANAQDKAGVNPQAITNKVQAHDWSGWFPTRSGRATTSTTDKAVKAIDDIAAKVGGLDALMAILAAKASEGNNSPNT